MNQLQEFDEVSLKKNIPQFKAGDTVKVHCKIKEGAKERIQIFEGVVICRHNSGISSSFTVRKVSHGVGVERVFPLHGPSIDKIDVTTVGKVRQSRIYYLRKLSGKKARIKAVDTRRQTQGKAAKPKAAVEAKAEAAPEAKAPTETPKAEEKPSTDQPAQEEKK